MYGRHRLILRKTLILKFRVCVQMSMNLYGRKFHCWSFLFVKLAMFLTLVLLVFSGLYLQNLLCFSLQANYGMTREKKIPEHQGSDLMWRGNEIMAQELFPPSHQLISTNLSSYFISVKQKHPHFKCN